MAKFSRSSSMVGLPSARAPSANSRGLHSEYSDKRVRTNDRFNNMLSVQYQEIERARKVIQDEMTHERKNLVQSIRNTRRKSCPVVPAFRSRSALQEKLEADRVAQDARIRHFLSESTLPDHHETTEEEPVIEAGKGVDADFETTGENTEKSNIGGTSSKEKTVLESKSEGRMSRDNNKTLQPSKTDKKQDFWNRLSQPKHSRKLSVPNDVEKGLSSMSTDSVPKKERRTSHLGSNTAKDPGKSP